MDRGLSQTPFSSQSIRTFKPQTLLDFVLPDYEGNGIPDTGQDVLLGQIRVVVPDDLNMREALADRL